MKVKFMKEIQYEIQKNFPIETLCKIIEGQFNDVVRTQRGRTIRIGRDKYISIDHFIKKKCSSYIELGNTYMRYDRTLEDILYIVKNDPYIKRNFKY